MNLRVIIFLLVLITVSHCTSTVIVICYEIRMYEWMSYLPQKCYSMRRI